MSVAPFGIKLGWPAPDDFASADHRISFGTPPAPHPNFDEYVCVSGRSGVGKIIAFTGPIENDDYGNSARSLFDRVSAQLASKYGCPDHSDFIEPDALWDADRDWAQAVRSGERIYVSFWTKEEQRLPEGLARIMLSVQDHEGFALKVVLTYEGDNWSEVSAEIEQDAADVL